MALPLPKVVADVEAGGPFVTAAKGVNALRKAQADAQWAPYTNYANAMSKTAYAQTAPAMALAQILGGPGAANMDRELYSQLANQANNSLRNVNTNFLPNPQNNNMGFGNSVFGNILGALAQRYFPQSQGQGGNNIMQQPGGAQQPQGQSPMGQQPEGQPTNISQQGTQALPFTSAASNLRVPGTQGGANPNTGAEATKAGMVAGTTGEITSQIKMWEPLHEEAAKEARLSQNTDDLADKFSDAYDRTSKWERGPGLGSVPPWFSEAAQTADNAANGMADAVARAQQMGHITQGDRTTYLSMKPNRNMRPETKERAMEFIRGMNERVQERVPFQVAAQKAGLTPQEANAVWNNYIKNNPFYSSKKHKLMEENFNKWPEYLSGEKLNQSLLPSSGNKNKSQSNNNQSKMFNILDPQGKIVAKGNLDQTSKFLKDHRGYSRVGI